MIIWLASYPRSGNTFARVIIQQLLGVKTFSVYKEDFKNESTLSIRSVVGQAELPLDFDWDAARHSPELFFIKTHQKNTPSFDADKAIYIVRDGRDAVCSYFHYERDIQQIQPPLIELIRDDRFPCRWADHVQSWHPLTRPNTLFLRFEDITRDPITAAKQIAEFTGIALKGTTIPSFDELHAANPKFFRQGKNGSYKTQMSPSEHKFFWMRHGQAMKEMGYTADEPKLSGWDKFLLGYKYRAHKRRQA